MWYNARVELDSEEFLLSEIIIELWRYRKFNDINTSNDHIRRLGNFRQQIDDWSKRKGLKNATCEYTAVCFLKENYMDHVKGGGYNGNRR